ncbi:hypothetical protein MPL1032_180139 [Mesorhizobium plurifarium]|uniref:Uncharacterized protein n=1 Tax=Mesorhizobium plurifarium TaxID=69974 RepID=A0A0K2VTR4_MESPL|nr:hypothetical protein MPL1032_180139 [Mesorhizobium plurifarium]
MPLKKRPAGRDQRLLEGSRGVSAEQALLSIIQTPLNRAIGFVLIRFSHACLSMAVAARMTTCESPLANVQRASRVFGVLSASGLRNFDAFIQIPARNSTK